jgi:hypothetical protein
MDSPIIADELFAYLEKHPDRPSPLDVMRVMDARERSSDAA